MPENRQIAEETCDKYVLKQNLSDNAKVCLVNSDHLQIELFNWKTYILCVLTQKMAAINQKNKAKMT